MKYVTLQNGITMPQLGFGVYQTAPEATEKAVSEALETGYRLIDTAASYGNEEGVGAAVAQSGIPREELFITTKLWVQDHGYDNTLRAFDTSMKKLGLEYLDLYLIHKPYGDYYGAWRAMERLYQEGRIRAIGVSSFWNERLADLCTMNDIQPAVNQIEINVWNQKWPETAFMKTQHVQPEAWAPFAEGNQGVFTNPVLQAIAQKYNKTTGQVCSAGSFSAASSSFPKRYINSAWKKICRSLTLPLMQRTYSKSRRSIQGAARFMTKWIRRRPSPLAR